MSPVLEFTCTSFSVLKFNLRIFCYEYLGTIFQKSLEKETTASHRKNATKNLFFASSSQHQFYNCAINYNKECHHMIDSIPPYYALVNRGHSLVTKYSHSRKTYNPNTAMPTFSLFTLTIFCSF